MMGWLRGILERLTYTLMSVVSAKLEARLQLELAEVRAELHERAAEYSGPLLEGGTALATPLLELSERIGAIDSGNVERLEYQRQAEQANEQPQNGTVIRSSKPQSKATEGSGDRKRGRPKKIADSPAMPPTVEMPADVTSASFSAEVQ